MDRIRRKLLTASAWAAGSLLAGTVSYQRPLLRSFFGVRAAWAQPTGGVILQIDGSLGVGAPGTQQNTGSDWWRLAVPSGGTRITISATSDRFLDVELFLFAPGVDPTIGTNLLTGSFGPYDVASLAAGETVTRTLGGPGNYVLVIEDARPPGSETVGTYSIVLTADPMIKSAIQIEDENAEIQMPSALPSPGPGRSRKALD